MPSVFSASPSGTNALIQHCIPSAIALSSPDTNVPVLLDSRTPCLYNAYRIYDSKGISHLHNYCYNVIGKTKI
jgi:hypothetical protein